MADSAPWRSGITGDKQGLARPRRQGEVGLVPGFAHAGQGTLQPRLLQTQRGQALVDRGQRDRGHRRPVQHVGHLHVHPGVLTDRVRFGVGRQGDPQVPVVAHEHQPTVVHNRAPVGGQRPRLEWRMG